MEGLPPSSPPPEQLTLLLPSPEFLSSHLKWNLYTFKRFSDCYFVQLVLALDAWKAQSSKIIQSSEFSRYLYLVSSEIDFSKTSLSRQHFPSGQIFLDDVFVFVPFIGLSYRLKLSRSAFSKDFAPYSYVFFPKSWDEDMQTNFAPTRNLVPREKLLAKSFNWLLSRESW